MIKENQKFFNVTFIVFDILVLFCSFCIAWFLKFQSGLLDYSLNLSFLHYIKTLIFILPTFIALQYMYDLYTPQRAKTLYIEIFNIIKSNFTLFLFILSILFIVKQIDISRQFILIFVITNILLSSIERSAIRIILRSIRSKGYNIKHVLVVGGGDLAVKYLKAIERNKYLGYSAIGILDDKIKSKSKIAGIPIIGLIDDLGDVLKQYIIDEVIIALPLKEYDRLKDMLSICEKAGVKTLIIPDYIKYVSTQPHIDEIDDIPLINTRYVPLDNIGKKSMKRLFDIIIALAVLAILFPFMGIIYMIIKINSPGPVIFKQKRVGYNRKSFIMYKFRTMKYELKSQLAEEQWTIEDDDRKTNVGKFLRKTSLDEIPQLFNVLKGDMSIVGPRPEQPFFVEQFKDEVPKYMIKHHVKPGLTGWAQVNGWRGDTSIVERIRHDIYYIEHWSFMFDIRILWLTIFKGFINKNAY